jgi:two-component system OmpR family sensor kinase
VTRDVATSAGDARSFRFTLAVRFTVTMAAAVVAMSVGILLAMKNRLDQELDASILAVASIQAASVTDAPSGAMHFHEWELTPDEAASVRELIRYAQVWSEDGMSLLRSQFMTSDLPLDRDALAEAGGGRLVWAEAEYEGNPVRALYYPLERLGAAHRRHVLQVAAPLRARNRMIEQMLVFFTGISILVVVGTWFGSWWLAGRVVRPVHEIIDQAEEIGVGSLDRRISAYADMSEYQRLVQVLNTMLDRIRQAFDAQRRFTADASHELRSPLTAMWGELEVALRREREPAEYRAALESTLEEVQRLSHITEDLLTLARSDAGALTPSPEPTDIAEIVRRTVDRLRARAEGKGVSLAADADDGVVTHVDPHLLSQVVWNLTDNAVKFTPPGGCVRVGVHARAGRDPTRIEVSDTGPGLGPEPRRVFERFYRHDQARSRAPDASGTGLGLAIVAAIAATLGARVEARNLPERGACFAVILPDVGAANE